MPSMYKNVVNLIVYLSIQGSYSPSPEETLRCTKYVKSLIKDKTPEELRTMKYVGE
jgi:hypothetical protein